MSETAHTPTPWELGGKHRDCEIFHNKIGVAFAREDHGRINGVTAKANAAHIVKCVNAHAYLVNALEHCKQIFLRYEINRVDHAEIEDEALKVIQIALAKAHPSGGDRHGE